MVPANKLRQTDWLRAAFQTGKRNLFTQYAYCSTKQNAELCGIVFIFCLEEEITTLPNFRIMALDDELPNCQSHKQTTAKIRFYFCFAILSHWKRHSLTGQNQMINTGKSWCNNMSMATFWVHQIRDYSTGKKYDHSMKGKKNTNDDGKT